MTLLEVMIASAAASIILTAVVTTYLAVTKVTAGGIAQLAVQSKARKGLDDIINDVRRSERAVIYSTYPAVGSTNADAGAYMIFQLSTNTLMTGEQQFHHYYIGNLKNLGNGITNGTLFFFDCAGETNLTTKSVDREIIRGVTNPDRVFDWVSGVVNINMRVADENDVDGNQIIYLRSAIAFRNGD